jgi:hypothetical protein
VLTFAAAMVQQSTHKERNGAPEPTCPISDSRASCRQGGAWRGDLSSPGGQFELRTLEKAPADLLGVSFPEAQERREVGWIGVREEREGEEEKEGKRRMGDGLILGGGENEGGGGGR